MKTPLVEIAKAHSALAAQLDALAAAADSEDEDLFLRCLSTLHNTVSEHFETEEHVFRLHAGQSLSDAHALEHRQILKVIEDGLKFSRGRFTSHDARRTLAQILKRWLEHEMTYSDPVVLESLLSAPSDP